MGTHNSVSSRMREHFPGIRIWTCICHSLHLCASEASKSLPTRCEDFVRQLYSYFSMSSKRSAEFIEFQQFCEVNVHKLLHPSQTRWWLSLLMVVSRMLEQWQALRLFFQSKASTERVNSVKFIYSCLNDPLIKLLFMFLDWILPKFTTLNALFQSTTVVITEIHTKMVLTYKEMLLTFMKPSYVNTHHICRMFVKLDYVIGPPDCYRQ